MAIYTIHSRDAAAAADDVRFIRDGFSWPALLFGPFWLATKGLWIALAIVLALDLAIMAAGTGLHIPRLALLPALLGINLLLGLEGGDVRRWTLALRGYREIAVEAGSSLEEAERRFFASLPAPEPLGPRSAPPQPPPHEADALGLFAPPGNA